MLYDDGRVALDEHGVTLRCYYLWGAAKHIPYGRITGVRERPLGPATGRWRFWGSGDLRHWYNLDVSRGTKRVAFDLSVGGWAIPVATPDRPDEVRTLLAAHVH